MPRDKTFLEREVEEMEKRRSSGAPTPGYQKGTIEGGKYYVEDDSGKREVSQEEYARLRAEPRRAYSAPTPGAEDLDAFAATMKKSPARPSVEDRRRAAMSELDSMKKGGKVKVPKSKVSTHQKSKKASSW